MFLNIIFSTKCIITFKTDGETEKQIFVPVLNLSMTLPFHSMSTDLFMQCLRHVSKQSLSSALKVDLIFPHKMLLVYLYLGRLVNKLLRILFPMNRKSPVTTCP